MDLSFIDTNNAFSNFVQQDALSTGPLAFENSQGSSQLFADKLNQVLEKFKTVQKSTLTEKNIPDIKGNLGKANISFGKDVPDIKGNLGKAKLFFSEEVVQEQGMQFLLGLKDFFLKLSGGDLNNISIDAQGLDVLKNMLLKAGFDSGEVDDLISGLSEKAQSGEAILGDLSLKEVMDSLFELSTEIEDDPTPEETIIETSALPFIISVLNSLGLPQEIVSQITSQADRGPKGISLDVVIDQLKSIESQSLYMDQSFRTQEGDTSFKMVFEQLGLMVQENTTSQLSLNDFLSSLETLKQELAEVKINTRDSGKMGLTNNIDIATTAVMAKESSVNLFESLVKHLYIQPEKTNMPEFSYGQIKDQIKNELLIPDKNNPENKGFFPKDQISSNVKSEQVLKEIESIISEKNGTTVDTKPLSKGEEDTAKFLKPDILRGEDASQVTASDVKIESASLNALKTKATVSNLPNYVMHQVGKSIVRAINQSENTLQLQLKPPELGRLFMTIDNVGNSMKVSIITENHAAKDVLTSNMNELKTVLANAGISLEKFDVDMNSNFRQSMADARNQSSQFGRKNQNRENSLFDAANTEGMNGPASGLVATLQDGSYHFVA